MIKYYQNLIDKVIDKFDREMDELIIKIQVEVINPFCDKYKIDFTCDDEMGFKFITKIDLNCSTLEEIINVYGKEFPKDYGTVLNIIETSVFSYKESIYDGLRSYRWKRI